MTTFKELIFKPMDLGGVKARVTFDNGYGASVIKSNISYGGNKGLYELAVLDDDGLCYDTPITDDVIDHLKPGDVTRLLKRIEGLERIGPK